jgi:hypothetical protein
MEGPRSRKGNKGGFNEAPSRSESPQERISAHASYRKGGLSGILSLVFDAIRVVRGFNRGVRRVRIFATAFVGGFLGKIAAAIFIAVCIALGIGPDRWAEFIISGLGEWATPERARIGFFVLAALTFLLVFVPSIISGQKKANSQPKLTYLRARRDYDLGPAIIEMAHGSAWGRWFAARHLVTTGKPIDERYWFQTAASMVMDKMMDGELVVRGRLHGQTGNDSVPQTDWRDIVLYYFPDNRARWKLRILPREGVTIQDDEVIDTDLSMATVAHITRYDSLLVDSHQFEHLWPRNEKIADSERRKFLKEARKRKLDLDTIKMLSDPFAFWAYFRRWTC